MDAAGAAGAIEHPAIAAAERAIEAWRDYEAKCDATMICENVVIDWRDENPLRENKASLPPWRAKEKRSSEARGTSKATEPSVVQASALIRLTMRSARQGLLPWKGYAPR